MQEQQYDAVVIGAGHNGLTAAAYLGAAGISTLVLERKGIVGGCCVTEEIAPGCRASTTSYMASMLRPEVIRDLNLGAHGLQMISCDPVVQVPFPDGGVIRLFLDARQTIAEIQKFSLRDASTFALVHDQLKNVARYLQPFFLEPPPDIGSRGLDAVWELLRVGKRFRKITGNEISQLVSFLTGSLGEFLDRNFESEYVKTMYLANNIYGKHGGPYESGTSLGLLFHLLSGGDHDLQGFCGHVIGGMGAITSALAAAARKRGVEIRTRAAVGQIIVREGRATGVALEDGTEISAKYVLSNADPKHTFLGLIAATDLAQEFRNQVMGIKMAGPCAKVNMVLSEEPRVKGISPQWPAAERALFTLVGSLEDAQHCYDVAKFGQIPEDLWIDCVVASNVDKTLAPAGRHVMTCFVQYVPYHLRCGTWDENRDVLRDRVLKKIGEYAPNVPNAVIECQVLTPLDLERTYGLTEGNIFHGDLNLEQLFFMRPVPGWSQYRTPVKALYLCGAGAHPGGGVTGAPGYNAAHQVLKDFRKVSLSRTRQKLFLSKYSKGDE
jgi:phytoene dehydrogenase-like protein